VLYARSRHAPITLAGTIGSVGTLWALGLASDRLSAEGRLGLLAVVAGIAVTGSGLAGMDIDLDRTASFAWPPRRAAHVLARTQPRRRGRP
jgi:hypothetical protein